MDGLEQVARIMKRRESEREKQRELQETAGINSSDYIVAWGYLSEKYPIGPGKIHGR